MILINQKNFQKRNIVLTIYLYLTLGIGIYLLKDDFQSVFSGPDFDNIFLLLIGLSDITFTIMILNWKKWAFYGLLITSLSILIFNLVNGYGILIAALGFFGFVIIYLLLLLKKNGISGWKNLE
ncbi:hypothetical protein [Cellulophaga sp. Hel_I_12]|uniref:hypothetical protein n=1 Tax=Cellulophaga sp. Hel_I_12 TaxID=1249972 RepID=UPI0006465559|nr:hypothetical protein [Cellulophaga sp. Hel_I_12]|tara:strand:+ start:4026 stop:4397 length:372 start_codon:yes stop_codon:yes gene_type:complete